MNRFVLAAGLAAFAPTLALAQATGPEPAVDTSALAYFTTHHDVTRADAELRRLRSLYPTWQPPADLSTLAPPDGAGADKPLWDLFGADKLDELDAAIAQRRSADPSWQPSADLADKLAAKRARQELIAASDRKDDAAVAAAAERRPDLVTADDLDVAWRVADSYGRLGRSATALVIDTRILDAVRDPQSRLTTVRKAMPVLQPADLDALLAKGRTGPDGHPEFDTLAVDLARLRVGRVLAAPRDGAKDADPADVAKLETSARAPDGAPDAALLGWLDARNNRWPDANGWFQLALATVPAPPQARPEDAKVVEGAVLALNAVGRSDEAESLAYTWRDRSPALGVAYVDGMVRELTQPEPVAVAADRLARFGQVTSQQQSGEGAQALGWYAYNLGQLPAAEAWFRRAMDWQPRDTTALGLALTLQRGGDKGAFLRFVAENRAAFPSLADLTRPHGRPTPGAVARHTAGPSDPAPVEAVRHRPALPRPVPVETARRAAPQPVRSAELPCTAATIAGADGRDPEAALRAGWCLMKLNRPKEAAIAFATAREGGSTRADAAYGQALAELRRHQVDPALQAANTDDLTPARRGEIGVAALAQAAIDAFDRGRYDEAIRALDRRRAFTPEPRDLATMRAWAEYHSGRKDRARDLFSALDRQQSTFDTRKGLAASSVPFTRS